MASKAVEYFFMGAYRERGGLFIMKGAISFPVVSSLSNGGVITYYIQNMNFCFNIAKNIHFCLAPLCTIISAIKDRNKMASEIH